MNMVQVGGVDSTNDWAQDFEDDFVVFNHENLLLERIVLDSAEYFSIKGGELYQEQKLESAHTHYGWARRLLERYESMIGKPIMADKRRELDQLINNIEDELAQ
ncbi:unnamed protein product [Rotaria sp. Silwood1]|nr:unnamed protein product [Rotaria sp. Silwood1]